MYCFTLHVEDVVASNTFFPVLQQIVLFFLLSFHPGLFGVVPAYHIVTLYDWNVVETNLGLSSLLGMAVAYIGGAFIYMLRFPECFFPGKCDIVVSSCAAFGALCSMLPGQ